MKISLADNGKTIDLEKGKDLIIELLGNNSAGYLWEMDRTEPLLPNPIKEYDLINPTTIGSTNIERFIWKAGVFRKDKYYITFIQERPWENKRPISVFNFTVRII